MSNLPPDPASHSADPLSPLQDFSSGETQEESGEEILPGWDIPMALPLAEPVEDEQTIPVALPLASAVSEAAPALEPLPALPAAPTAPAPRTDILAGPAAAEILALVKAEPPAPPAPTSIACPACRAVNTLDQTFCADCGYYFSADDLAALTAGPAAAPATPTILEGRYELGELVSDRLGVQRFKGIDHGPADGGPRLTVEVVIVRQKIPAGEPPPGADRGDNSDTEDILPSFDEPPSSNFPATDVLTSQPLWPSVGWERKLLQTLEHPGLPCERDYFADDEYEYLVEECPTGKSLWDAWDDPDAGAAERFGRLAELAKILQMLHQCNAMVEGLRPDIVVIDDGRVRLGDLGDLLPIPLPRNAPVRGSLYTAPELLGGIGDARADLYGFGAMLYALHVGRELNERTDFDGPGNPKPFIPRFPDIHPAFGRLMMKTFRKQVEARFPSDEASRDDATGFSELVRTLDVLGRTHDNVRLDIASWTSTGIVRTGNEDAFAVLHACESRQDDVGEAALIILCDGMGGYEAGEIAAALTIQSLRKQLVQLPPFNVTAGASPFATDPLTQMSHPGGHMAAPPDVEAVKQALRAALREANRFVFQTSRAPGSKRRGMGCTAEVVYIDGRNVVVGHVGDSRTYHLHEGRLVQLTRDQTLVNRLVELGSLSEEEAETHPRRNELQQAIGGQPDVEPGVYAGKMTAGDWVIVCSDGLTNHVNARDLQHMLQSEAGSAEMCARRLINLTLIEGATDNVTVVAVRAT